MKVHTRPTFKRTEATKLHFSVEHPTTRERVRSVVITTDEAQESIAYLREHNGNAPEFVKEFINCMEIACNLVWYQ